MKILLFPGLVSQLIAVTAARWTRITSLAIIIVIIVIMIAIRIMRMIGWTPPLLQLIRFTKPTRRTIY